MGFLQDGNAQIAGRYNPVAAASYRGLILKDMFPVCVWMFPPINIVVQWEPLMAILLSAWAVKAKLMNWTSQQQSLTGLYCSLAEAPVLIPAVNLRRNLPIATRLPGRNSRFWAQWQNFIIGI